MTGRILVVESDPPEACGVWGALSSEGYSVATCGTARQGYEAIGRYHFDALILSSRLPDSDGFEVCRKLRTHSEIAILLLTPRDSEIDRIIGLEIGADDCLAKPFGTGELLARLRAVTRRRGTSLKPAETSLEIGRLRIERSQRIVLLDGIERTLTRHQYSLLLALAENAGRVFSRGDLLDIMKAGAGVGLDRSVDVQICRLRSQIEDDPQNPQRLITVRRAGYLFER